MSQYNLIVIYVTLIPFKNTKVCLHPFYDVTPILRTLVTLHQKSHSSHFCTLALFFIYREASVESLDRFVRQFEAVS